MKRVTLVLPSPRLSGGVKEAIHLMSEVALSAPDGAQAKCMILWHSPEHSGHLPATWAGELIALSKWPARLKQAWWQWPVLAWRFLRYAKSAHAQGSSWSWVFTHYVTVPLSLLVPQQSRWFFVQDLEWRFLGEGFPSKCLKHILTWVYLKGHVIAANSYVSDGLRAEGVDVHCEFPIWASRAFGEVTVPVVRDIDVLMVVRKGAAKRPELYLQWLRMFRQAGRTEAVHVIATDNVLTESMAALGAHVSLHLSREQMASLYARSRIFLLLSEHEGFGLPPLEAMASGCVPVCRQAGGTAAYMTGDLASVHLPLDLSAGEIAEAVNALLDDPVVWQRLSDAGRRVFRQGLAVGRRARASTVDAIWSQR